MPVARTWRRPRPFAVVLTVAAMAAFVIAGRWQIGRGAEKEALLADFERVQTAAPVPLADARQRADTARYTRVTVTGRYDGHHAYALDNQSRHGRAGILAFDVFAPTDGSQPLLVSRGFLPRAADGTRPAMPTAPSDEQTVVGLYAPPPTSGLRMGGNQLPAQRHWPKTVIYLDPNEVAADSGIALDTHVLLLDGAASDGFVHEWRPELMPPSRHYGYAFQWFALASAALALFIALHWRRSQDSR